MKKLMLMVVVLTVFISCEKVDQEIGSAPEIPPVETMVIDFSQMAQKSTSIVKSNWLFSAATVGVWNTIIATTFAIPVASFKASFNHQPTKVNDNAWQWQYDVDGFTSRYTARLVGSLEPSHVKWEMYISKEGIESFEEFLWFEGTSQLDGNSGQWVLNNSAKFPEKTIQIDWQKQSDEIGEIVYTYVREMNDMGEADHFKGSTLTYGLQDGEYDIFVNVHAHDKQSQKFNDTFIEWSRATFDGHVKAEHFFNDMEWHCWDSNGDNIDCN